MRPAYLVRSHFPSSPVNSQSYFLLFIYVRSRRDAHSVTPSLPFQHTDTPLVILWIIIIRQAYVEQKEQNKDFNFSLPSPTTAMKIDDVYPLPPAAHK